MICAVCCDYGSYVWLKVGKVVVGGIVTRQDCHWHDVLVTSTVLGDGRAVVVV